MLKADYRRVHEVLDNGNDILKSLRQAEVIDSKLAWSVLKYTYKMAYYEYKIARTRAKTRKVWIESIGLRAEIMLALRNTPQDDH